MISAVYMKLLAVSVSDLYVKGLGLHVQCFGSRKGDSLRLKVHRDHAVLAVSDRNCVHGDSRSPMPQHMKLFDLLMPSRFCG
jgi:hypothetical protein